MVQEMNTHYRRARVSDSVNCSFLLWFYGSSTVSASTCCLLRAWSPLLSDSSVHSFAHFQIERSFFYYLFRIISWISNFNDDLNWIHFQHECKFASWSRWLFGIKWWYYVWLELWPQVVIINIVLSLSWFLSITLLDPSLVESILILLFLFEKTDAVGS